MLLAYCIVLEEGPTVYPSEGVLDSKIVPVAESGLIALCAELERSSISATNFQRSALEFHRVVQAMLVEKAVVPFRFPTWLSADEMRAHLRQASAQYRDFLLRHADHLQMEVRVSKRAVNSPAVTSGAEHLRAKAAQLRAVMDQADEIKNLVSEEVIEWRQRETVDGVCLYALIARKSVEQFRETLNRSAVRASGPWPATEFLDQPSEKD